MKSRGLQAALSALSLTLFGWITLTNRNTPSRVFSYSTPATTTHTNIVPLDTAPLAPPANDVSKAIFSDSLQPTHNVAPEGLSTEGLEELLRAARHWTNGKLTDADVAKIRASYDHTPQAPNGRPSLPQAAAANIPILDSDFKNGHTPEPVPDESGLDDQFVENIVESIFDLGNTRFWRMECPGQEEPGARYNILKTVARNDKIKYFFALDLTQIARILPRLMGTIVKVIQFLGPEHCALSIVEGRSDDGTYRILHSMGKLLIQNKVEYYLQQTDIDPHGAGQDRIGALAVLRNMAMQPLIDQKEKFAEETVTIFVNDIAVCPDDVLELVYQHVYQNASMTCATDWVFGGDVFYDSWVSRSMSGNTFFEIAQDMSWAFHKNMFWDDPISKPKYQDFHPFQCYSCWGGMVTLDSRPFQDGRVTFRNATEDECYAGEPTLLAQDLHRIGFGRVATIPSVNVAYNDGEGSRTKKRRGHVKDRVNVSEIIPPWYDDPKSPKIDWRPPPGQIKCMPHWTQQSWVPPF